MTLSDDRKMLFSVGLRQKHSKTIAAQIITCCYKARQTDKITYVDIHEILKTVIF